MCRGKPTIAAVCPMVPACSALAPAVLLTLLGWRMRTAGPATMAGGTPPGAGLTPCCGGWVRDCWLFSKDSRRAGRLFCWRAERRQREREKERESAARGFRDTRAKWDARWQKTKSFSTVLLFKTFKATSTMGEAWTSSMHNYKQSAVMHCPWLLKALHCRKQLHVF